MRVRNIFNRNVCEVFSPEGNISGKNFVFGRISKASSGKRLGNGDTPNLSTCGLARVRWGGGRRKGND